MTNLAALIRAARASHGGSGYRSAKEGNITVQVVPVQPRGTSNRLSERADVYVDGKRLKTSEVEALLKTEG